MHQLKLSILLLLLLSLTSCAKDSLNEDISTNEDTLLIDDNNTNDNHEEEKKDTIHISYLALGDSYTIGQGVLETQRFPYQFLNRLKSQHEITSFNIQYRATTGWTTSNLLQNLHLNPIKDTFDLVSLLIGVNNQFQNLDTSFYPTQFKQLVDSAITYANGDKNKIFVLSIPDYYFTPFGQSRSASISSAIDWYNEVNKQICLTYGIAYFSITEISRKGIENPDLVAGDLLHPSAIQYGLWVNTFYSSLLNQLKKL